MTERGQIGPISVVALTHFCHGRSTRFRRPGMTEISEGGRRDGGTASGALRCARAGASVHARTPDGSMHARAHMSGVPECQAVQDRPMPETCQHCVAPALGRCREAQARTRTRTKGADEDSDKGRKAPDVEDLSESSDEEDYLV